MENLVKKLNEYNYLYDLGKPIISDTEYDNLYFKLIEMEKELGYTLPNSPTQIINYEIKNELKKVEHNHPMLSLDKTKDWDEFLNYFGHKDVIGMLKLDGLTCSLRYLNGRLISAETRGNGKIGEDILHNAKVVKNIPKTIPFKDELIIDGEIICTYENFEPFENEYKNPRNFASGSIRLLDSKECEKRNLSFIAWNVITPLTNRVIDNFHKIKEFGFTVVPWTSSYDWDASDFLIEQADYHGYPIDGLVGRFDDISYGESLGSTEHHSRAAYAFKFQDVECETELLDIEWTMGRTGQLTPIAVFNPIEIDGTVIERASLHNLSVMDELSCGFQRKGDLISVYKANAIIPQIKNWVHMGNFSNETHINLPQFCPICGSELSIDISDSGVKNLVCNNSQCNGKIINQLDHFCGKSGLDIKGLSRATLEKLLDWGWIETAKDIFELKNHNLEWTRKPSFGPQSVNNILTAIEKSKNTTLNNFIVAIGIPLIGKAQSKEICKVCKSYEDFREKIKNNYNWSELNTFGEVKSSNINNFDYSIVDEIYPYLNIEINENNSNEKLKGLTFVITGSVKEWKNRDELKSFIENMGGKVSGSVSKNTSYLINNDVNSTTGKNKKAKELNIPIISEENFKKFLDK